MNGDTLPRRVASGEAWTPTAFDGRYELRGALGQGGSGLVYRAFDRVLAREVALKTLKTVSAEDMYRLKKEFRTLADVAHPHLIRLYDLVATSERCFFTMELVQGPDILTWAWRSERPEVGAALSPAGIDRLKRGLIQLVHGLQALHDLGRVHRDIKPSNVLVGPGDRVVLLDVGLVSRLESRESEYSRTGWIVGTLQYMAPEQTWGRPITAAADWYSLGVVLYEGLTGRLPYDEWNPRLLSALREGNEPPTCPAGVPEELTALVRRLLDPNPDRRPGGDDVLAVLGGPRAISSRPRGPRSFVGRARELAWLQGLFGAASRGKKVFGRIKGDAGLGKTDLVTTFVSGLDRDGDVLVLRGRCHCRESVTFRALDGAVDSLTRFMARLDSSELSELLPADVAALFQVFPVFRRIETLARLQPVAPTVYDFRLRHRAFVALRELFRRITSRRVLVLWIDDLQWADRDSTLFLRSLQQATALERFLCLYTFRTDPLESYVLALTTAEVRGGVAADLELGPLEPADALALVRGLVGQATPAQLQALVASSAAVPLFAQLLCRSLFQDGPELDVTKVWSFEDFIERIVATLPPNARAILQVICVAGYPVEHRLIAAMWPGESESATARLHEAGLIRQSDRERLRWEAAHDRIRECVSSHVNAAERGAITERMMRALEALPNPNPHDLIEHLLAGGHTEQAMQRALDGASVAEERAAFQLASSLYRRALELGVPPEQEWRVQASLGRALINLGLGREGARALVTAAEVLAREEADHPQVLRLRSVAGERLLLGGHWQEGIELVRGTMKAVGVVQAKSAGGALFRGVLLMPLAAWGERRWRTRETAGDAVKPAATGPEAIRLEVVWSAGLAIAWLDPMRAIELHVRHAVFAYRVGDRGHIARSKSVEAVILAMRGGTKRWHRAVETQEVAQRLADLSGDADVQAFIALHWGLIHFFMGKWRDGQRLCGSALTLGFMKGISAIPEMLMAQWIAMNCLVYLGEIEEVRSQLPDCMMAAEARDEQLSMSCIRLGWVNFVYLCDGDLEGALAEARRAIAPYERSSFNSAHYLNVICRVNAELYRDRPDAACKVVEEAWRGLVASRQLEMTTVHCEMHEVRGRAALARLACVEDARLCRPWVDQLNVCVRELSRSAMDCAQAFASVLLSGRAALQGKLGDAIEHLERALLGFQRLEMNMHAASCRWRLGRWLSGPRAQELESAARTWFASQNVKEPDRIVRVLLAVPEGAGRSPISSPAGHAVASSSPS